MAHDDDLADKAQQLLDAMNYFLRDSRIVAALTADDLTSMRDDRDDLEKKLKYYRVITYSKGRRSGQRLDRVDGKPIPVIISGLVLSEDAGAAGGASAVDVAALLADVILPIAAAVAFAAALSAITGGSLKEGAARKLGEAAEQIASDLQDLAALSTSLAITAEAVEKLTDVDLLNTLIKVAKAGRWVPFTIVIAELARRFPQCLAAIQAFKEAFRKVNQLRGTGNRPSALGLAKLWTALLDTQEAMQDCIVASTRGRTYGKRNVKE